ncbi:MAG TPA: HAD family phosphatase [Phycisphaerae bacterium]|nr:HAD family phosphatase [Phycisphaerae bacterium]
MDASRHRSDTRAAIFDVDGVLVDSYRAHFEAWQRLGREFGRDLAEERFAASFGRRNAELMDELWEGAVPSDQVDTWGDWKEARYREILLADFPAMAGAAELIDALKAAGFRLAVGSSGPPENVACALEGLGRAGAFDATVDGSEVVRGKPDPEVFLTAAAKLGVEPARCAVFEDALAGVEAARRAGMTPIALVGTAPRERLAEHAALVVDSLREVTPQRVAELIDAANA